MGKWQIAKEFSLDYGHRVWTQVLDGEFSLDTACACRHLHGHRGTIKVYLESDNLVNGMVTDFKHLNWFKKFIDETLDHKMILDSNDPLSTYLLCGRSFNPNYTKQPQGHYVYTGAIIEPKHIVEALSGYVFVDFVPTSENLSAWLHKIVSEKMRNLGIKVSRIQFFETPKSQSNYCED